MTRFRSRNAVQSSGHATVRNALGEIVLELDEGDGQSYPGQVDDSVDVNDFPYHDHPLTLSSLKLWSATLSGSSKSSLNFQEVDLEVKGWAVRRVSSAVVPSHSGVNWPFYTTKAIANANPGNPSIDLPLFLWELREFPRMLKELGDILVSINKGYTIQQMLANFPDFYRKQALALQFGWAPLIADLKSSLKLAKTIDDNARLINDAKSGRKIHRSLGNVSYAPVYGSDFDVRIPGLSNQDTIQWTGRDEWTGHEKAWYSAKLKVSEPLTTSSLAPDSVINQLGLFPSAALLWESIPWTWLLDYLGNFGTYLDTKRGHIPYQIENFNLMVRQSWEGKFVTSYIRNGLALKPGRMSRTVKSRHQPLPIASISYNPYPMKGIRPIIVGFVMAPYLRRIFR